jgi:hypothetical protein
MITGFIVTILILWLLGTIIELLVLFIGYVINSISKGNKKFDKKTTVPIKRNHQLFSPGYSQVLKHFVKELDNMYISILSDENIATQLKGTGQLKSTIETFVSNAIVFDLVQTYKMLLPDSLTEIRFESSGLVVVASSLMTNLPNYTQKTNFNIAVAHQNGELFNLAKQLLDNIVAEDNPIKIDIKIKNEDRLVSQHQNENNFALPAFLCITDNPLHDKYATMLHRFATIIAQADSKLIDFKEEEVLNEIYQLVHHPIPEKDNLTIIEDTDYERK